MKKNNYRELTSVDDCVKKQGYDPATCFPDVSKCPEHLQALFLSMCRTVVVNEAITENWEPDWNDPCQPKHVGIVDMEETAENPSGFALFHVSDSNPIAFAGLGSRHHFQEADMVRHAFNIAEEDYRIIAQKKQS